MADPHLIDDADIEAFLDAARRDPNVLDHVRRCDACLAKVRAARRERLLARAGLERGPLQSDHLDPATMAAFCDERLDDVPTRAAATHLARCPTCLDHYLDLVIALEPPPPVGATSRSRMADRPIEASAIRDREVAPTGAGAAWLVPTPSTHGTVFITRFANALALTYVAAATPPPAHTLLFDVSARSGSRDLPDREMRFRRERATPRAARVELRSRSMTDVMRGLAARARTPSPPRPSVRIELPNVIATLELVDLHDGQVEIELSALPTQRGVSTVRVTVSAPRYGPTRHTLAPAKPLPLGPVPTPATLAFLDDAGEPALVEIRNLVRREPST
jgi:hypothetical protein